MRLFFLLLLLLAGLPSREQDNIPAYTAFFHHGECAPAAYRLAMRGYQRLADAGIVANRRYLAILDFTKPSNRRRLFVLDVPARQLALSSIVAHGYGSDPDSTAYAQQFSNRNGSRASSLGFYLTGETYANHRPTDSLGLCLFGLDKGYNDSAAIREIVMHYGATEFAGHVYVSDSGAARSSGCPALPLSANSRVIRMIRGGAVLFLYSDKDKAYPEKSTVLNRALPLPIRQQGPPPNNCSCNLRKL